ncbi:MAG: site-specific integrase [Clostridiales bacterium]|nr:site-specific integrase [Clostridiales bacterium]
MAKDLKGKELPKGIRQRKNGRYEGRIKYDYQSYSVYGDTITEVKKAMTELRYKLEHGLFIADSKITLEDWFKTWIQEYKVNHVKVGTIITYKKCFECYIKENLGNKKIVDLRGEHIQRLYNSLIKENKSVSTVELVSALLNSCLRQAVKNGIIERNPVPLATMPRKKAKEERRVLTVEEQEIFFKYAKDSFYYPVFMLAIRTGMRSGELRGLKFTDIDKAAGVIHVVRTLKYEAKRGYFEDTPKTGTSKRDIPLTQEMIDIIDIQRKQVGNKVIKLDGYVFTAPDGNVICNGQLQNEIDRILDSINKDGIAFERFTPHCFRHTFATRAIENGMNPQTLKVIIGHSTLAMTMDLYAHVLPTTKKEEMEKISKAF